jgi:hypothetical protein
VQNQTRHAWLRAGFEHCRHVHTVLGESTIQMNIHEHLFRKMTQMVRASGIVESKLCAIFASGES